MRPQGIRRKLFHTLGMLKFILAKRLGYATNYHVVFQAGPQITAMTVVMSPWLCADNYKQLMEFGNEHACKGAAITCITKLGGPA